MSEQDDRTPEGWYSLHEQFHITPLVPAEAHGEDMRFNIPFQTFVISVKSDSDIGHLWNEDPLGAIDKLDGDGKHFALPRRDDGTFDDVRVITLRVNAERPSNPKYTRSLVAKVPGSTTLVIVHYKDQRDAAGDCP